MKPVIAFLVGAVGGLLFLVAFAVAVLSELGPYLAAFGLVVVVIVVAAAIGVANSSQPGARPYWERSADNSHNSHSSYSGFSSHTGPVRALASAAAPLRQVGYQPSAAPQPMPWGYEVVEGEVIEAAPSAPAAPEFRQRRQGSRFVARIGVGR